MDVCPSVPFPTHPLNCVTDAQGTAVRKCLAQCRIKDHQHNQSQSINHVSLSSATFACLQFKERWCKAGKQERSWRKSSPSKVIPHYFGPYFQMYFQHLRIGGGGIGSPGRTTDRCSNFCCFGETQTLSLPTNPLCAFNTTYSWEAVKGKERLDLLNPSRL